MKPVEYSLIRSKLNHCPRKRVHLKYVFILSADKDIGHVLKACKYSPGMQESLWYENNIIPILKKCNHFEEYECKHTVAEDTLIILKRESTIYS